ncbi:MAG: DUF3592 domain-containing protein [Bacteroidota bacterium]|nr:MAG: DUF3592 domain-containing protein [Bacteroidota bacterium]
MNNKELNIDSIEFKKIKKYLILLNFKTLFGLFFFLIGLVFTIVIIQSFNRSSFILDWGETFIAEGRIVKVNKTMFGYGDENSHEPIYEYCYSYIVNDVVLRDKAYGTNKIYSVGDIVKVIVKSKNYNISKISGLRKSPFGLLALSLIILPIAGLIVLISGILWGKNKSKILSNGVYTIGRCFKSIEDNSAQSDDKYFKHFLEYIDLDGNKCVTSYSNLKKEIKPEIELVFNKTNPQENYIFDSMPIIFKNKIIKNCR